MSNQKVFIHGFAAYSISGDGTVTSHKGNSPKALRPRMGGNGYLTVCLRKDNRNYEKYVHRLVVETYNRPLLAGEQVNHINGDKTNNYISNLEIVTPAQNSQHAWSTGLSHREQGNRCKLTAAQVARIKELRDTGLLLREIAAIFEVSTGTISMIINRKTWNE